MGHKVLLNLKEYKSGASTFLKGDKLKLHPIYQVITTLVHTLQEFRVAPYHITAIVTTFSQEIIKFVNHVASSGFPSHKITL